MDILINKSETKSLGKQLLSCSDDLTDEIKKFLTMVENIDVSCDGHEGISKHINVMRETYALEMNKFVDAIKEFGDYLANVPEAYEILDESFSTGEIGV